ncbi:MAG: hypothetical protein ACI9IP_000904 [Arcticibacterium sp.]|jgi:hypothetical protein
MKQSYLILFISILVSFSIKAQVAPQPSPGASFSQTVGITRINVEYSRPGVKGRTIFGGLLKYGELWRTGANAPTIISLSNDVKINGATLLAGDYSLHSFPGEKTWKIVFNTDLDAAQNTYNELDNALLVIVEPKKVDFTETFTIDISDIHTDMARLNIYWEHTAVSLQITVDNESAINNEILIRNNEAAGAFQQAAEYMVNKNMDLAVALENIEKSIFLKETFRNTWIKSVILKQMGRNTDALKMAIKAQTLGKTDPVYQLFKDAVESSIIELRSSVPSN